VLIHVESLQLASPWAFVIVTVLALIDGVVPLVPARTAMVGLGVACAAGDTRAYPLLAVATAAAFVGDNISYALGAHLWPRIRPILFRGPRAERAWAWLELELRRRGLFLVAVDRVVPGGPTPITLSAGALRIPIGRFRAAAAASAVLWSIYAAVTGVFGELAVGDNLVLALLIGLSIVTVVNVTLRMGMRWARRRGAANDEELASRASGAARPGPATCAVTSSAEGERRMAMRVEEGAVSAGKSAHRA
jgi:membrane protein DedA with SNARE-associated domain